MSAARVSLSLGAVALVLATIAIFATQVSTWHLIGGSDNAFLAECVDNINTRGLPYTSVNRASHRYITLVNEFEEFDDFPDAIAPAPPAEINQFHRHSYVALYLLAPFARWCDPALVLTAAKTLSLMAVVALAFAMLLWRTGRAWPALAFAALVVAHPFFSSSLGWQVYVDFLFLPAGFLLCRGLHTQPGARSTMLWALACCLVCEKFIFVTALLTATFGVLFHQRRTRAAMLFAAAGLAALFVVVSKTARWIEPDYTVEAHYRYGMWLQILLSPTSLKNSVTLLFVSFLVYLPILFRDRRLVAVLLVALLPNLLGSVGGSEKTGWATHYHVTYFPVLAYVLYAALALRAGDRQRRSFGARALLALGFVLATCHPLALDIRHVTRGPDFTTASQWFPLQFAQLQRTHARAEPTLSALRELAREVPAGARLSISANVATTLYPGRVLDFFPIGIDHADLLVLHQNDCRRTGDGFDFVLPKFAGDADTDRRFDEFVTERVAARFDVDDPASFGPWLLFRPRG